MSFKEFQQRRQLEAAASSPVPAPAPPPAPTAPAPTEPMDDAPTESSGAAAPTTWRVKGKRGVLVREAVSLDSALVGELPHGAPPRERPGRRARATRALGPPAHQRAGGPAAAPGPLALRPGRKSRRGARARRQQSPVALLPAADIFGERPVHAACAVLSPAATAAARASLLADEVGISLDDAPAPPREALRLSLIHI